MTAEERSQRPREFPYKAGKPWLGADRREESEEFIAGNRAGLEALREAVDTALEEGRAEIDIAFTDYPGVVRVEGDPREIERQKPTAMEWMAALVSFLLVPALVVGGTVMAILLIKWLWNLGLAQ